MFGYVKICQPELKMGEFEQYRGMYCSLCRCLGRRYGCSAQMALSYDMTFLTLLYLALAEECAGFRRGHCPYNPFKKRTLCSAHPALDRTADISVLLTYHKIKDVIADGGFAKRCAARMALLPVSRHRRRAARRAPELDRAAAAYMESQAALEAAQCSSLDAAAEPTAQLMVRLLAPTADEDKQRRVLERFGYCLGRWIYLMDAADDLEEDSRTGSYNPLLAGRPEKLTPEYLAECRHRVRLSLNASLAECCAAYELLNIRRFDGILRNILEQGMPQMQQTVLTGKSKKRTGRVSQNEGSV